jgi:L-lactate utilization protein LutC
MSEARAQILASLQKISRPGQGRSPADSPRPAVTGRLVEAFAERLKAVSGGISILPDANALGAAVADYLAQYELGNDIVAAPHPLLGRTAWPPHLVLHRRPAEGGDRIALTVAFAGIAETGSLVMLSGPDTPTTLNFLPDHCLIVLERSRLYPNLESVWPLLRARGPLPPRSVNLVTGPSRTADVEQTIQLGAHGPRWLQVLICE